MPKTRAEIDVFWTDFFIFEKIRQKRQKNISKRNLMGKKNIRSPSDILQASEKFEIR
jgi:hypothetical protein